MRLPLLALAALAVVPFQIACDFDSIAEASDHFKEDFQYSYDLKPGGRLTLETFNGSVEIVGWEKDSVQVTGTKSAGREESAIASRIVSSGIECRADRQRASLVFDGPGFHSRGRHWRASEESLERRPEAVASRWLRQKPPLLCPPPRSLKPSRYRRC